MKLYGDTSKAPVIVIHGGIAASAGEAERDRRRQTVLRQVIGEVWKELSAGASALDSVEQAVKLLEAEPDFNAGRGGILQQDGLARLSASMMDGEREKFSAVALVTNLIHPSKLARALQDRDDTVLGPYGAQLLARELGLPCENPATLEQLEKFVEFHRQRISGGKEESNRTGTVGAVVLDSAGRMAASTSTGGNTTNFPERMSDSSTVAGNFASRFAAISCTGIGEQIMNHGAAVRLETRVRDGKTIKQSSQMLLDEAVPAGNRFGWIAVDKHGNWSISRTSGIIFAAALGTGEKEPFIADQI